MDELSWIHDPVALIAAAVAFVVWLVRLEGRINVNADLFKVNHENLQKLENRHEALDSKIVDKLSIIEKSLAKIEGRLEPRREIKP